MLRLAWPIVLAELGWQTMGIVDTIVVGRLPDSAESIAAVSLGTILFYTIGIFGSGLLLGLDTLVSQAFGANDRVDGHRSIVNAVYLSVPLSLVLMAILWGARPLLGMIGERPEVMRLTIPYLTTLTWSIMPLLLYFALRRYLQAINLVHPVMFALISANVINLLGNVMLVYGKWGAPALGVGGSAWATVISRIYMAGVLAIVWAMHERPGRDWPWKPSLKRMARLLRLGIPAGSQILLETGVFAMAAVLIGRLDSASLAAHQIALNAAAFTFMVTLGIGSAAAVRVGQALGRKDTMGAAHSGWMALILGVGFMTFAAAVFWTFPSYLARIYTSDPRVIQISVALLFIAGIFQIFDGTQIVLAGALRGAGDTHTPLFSHLFGYWFIGLPLGYYLCFSRHWGAVGIWTGLCAGLIAIGSILLGLWWMRVSRWQHTRDNLKEAW
jgi:MATE family multidrug resistance protein